MNKNSRAPSRRKLVKTLLIGGAVSAGQALPQQWAKPVIKNVLVPAHAQTSCTVLECSSGGFSVSSTTMSLNYCVIVASDLSTIPNEPTCQVRIDGNLVPSAFLDGMFADELGVDTYVCCASYSNIPLQSGTVSVFVEDDNGACEIDIGFIPDTTNFSGPFSGCGTSG